MAPEGADGKLSTLLDSVNAAFRNSNFKELDIQATAIGATLDESADAAVLSLRSKHSELREKLKLLEIENAALKRDKNAEDQELHEDKEERAELAHFGAELEARVLKIEQEKNALMETVDFMKGEKVELQAQVLNMEQENIALKAENKTSKQQKAQLETRVLDT